MIDAPKSSKSFRHKIRHNGRKWWRKVLVVQDTPHRVALGFAIGLFIGLLPIVGIQMIVAFVICWVARANLIASIPPVWISNPVTLVPLYYILNRVGGLFVGEVVTMKTITSLPAELRSRSWHDAMAFLLSDLWGAFSAMFVGGCIVGVIGAVPAYFLVRKAVEGYQRRKLERRLRWLESHQERLAKEPLRTRLVRKITRRDPDGDQADKPAE